MSTFILILFSYWANSTSFLYLLLSKYSSISCSTNGCLCRNERFNYAYLSEQDAEGISWYFLLSSLHPHEYLLFPMPGIWSSLLKNFKPSPKGHQSLWNLLLTFLVILIFPFIVTPATWYVTHLMNTQTSFSLSHKCWPFLPKSLRL